MRLLVAAALLALCLPATAGPPAEGGRPRVGLVLSGGGARGAAHVGVLKVLEELHVPVDVVAGTSMGSIVGGLYATGMSPAEMETVLAEMDWDDAFDDDVPRAELPIRRKEERDIFRVGIALGFRGGKLGLPSGLVAGQKLNYILRTLTLPSALVRDFDRLPIPFRAVGTDAANGHRIVLRSGDVAEAIRASMAFPGLFAPVEIDGHLLVDGGVAENFPVQTAREAGAQRLIAVDISAPPVGKEELGDLVKILGQVTSMATSLNVERSRKALGPDDVFIEPQLGTLSFLDFDKAPEAVALGEQAARAAADRLRAFSLPDAEWEAWLARTRRRPQPPMQIALVRVVNTSRLSDAAVLERVRSRSGPLDLEVLRADLGRIYALQQFDLVDFRIVEEGGRNVLEIVTEERAWGYTRMRFALDLKTDLKGDSSFQLDVGLIRTSINRLGGEWRLMAGVGATEWLGAELYQPVVPSGALFVAPSVSWRTDRVEIPIIDSSLFADYRKRVLAGNVDLGLALDPLAELRLGLERGYLWADPRTGSELPVERQDRGAVLAKALLDSRDDESFPRSGAALAAEMRWESHALGGRDSFRRLEAIGLLAFSLGDSTVQLIAEGGSPLRSELEYFDQFFLGGFRHLSGYRPNELYGPYCAFGSVTYLRALGGRVPFLGGQAFAGLGFEAGNAWENGADVSVSDLKTSVTVFAGTKTLLGPLQIGLGLAGGGRSVVYLNLGRTF